MRLIMTSLLTLLLVAPAFSKSFTAKQAHRICSKNDIAMLKRLLRSGYDINSRFQYSDNKSSKTLLTYSLHYSGIYTNNYKVAYWLIKSGADVNTMGDQDLHPLIMASGIENITIARLMLIKGADVNGTMKDQTTRPLLRAINTNNLRMIQLLLRYQADGNAKNSAGDAPLHIASRNNNIEAVKILLLARAKVDIKGRNGQTPLHDAVRVGNVEMIKVLLQHRAYPYKVDKYQKGPFDKAFFSDASMMRRIRSDSYLHNFFITNRLYRRRYRKSIKKLEKAGVIYIAKKPVKKKRTLTRQEIRRKKIGTMNMVKDFAIAPLWLGTSIFLREYTYKSNPQGNHFGMVNGIVAGTSIGVVTGAAIGYGLGTLFDRIGKKSRNSFGNIIGTMIVTSVLSGIVGGYLGYRYRKEFKGDKAMYYGTASLITVSIIAIRF